MLVVLAHIGGVPVEENLAAAPAVIAVTALVGARLRVWVSALLGSRDRTPRRHRGQRDDRDRETLSA
jgi:hypothetical protein